MDRRTSLKKNIMFWFVIIVLSMVGIIEIIIFTAWKTSINDLIVHMENEITSTINESIEIFLNIPLAINGSNYSFIQHEVVNVYNRKQREAYFVGVYKQVLWKYIALALVRNRGNIMVSAEIQTMK